jgi:HSF-type DNA-binding
VQVMEEPEGKTISGKEQALAATTNSMENVESGGDGTASIDDDDDDASVTDGPHHEQQLDITTSSTSTTVPKNVRQMGLPPPCPWYGYPPVPGYVPGYLPYGGTPYPYHHMTTSPYLPPPSSSTAFSRKMRYVDNAHLADPEPNPRRNRGGIAQPFPEVLHHMLSTLEQEGSADVASFFPHGRAFAIHNPRIFVSTVMPRFFKQTKLTSFQRQLNLYSFKRIVEGGVDNGGYWVRSGWNCRNSVPKG